MTAPQWPDERMPNYAQAQKQLQLLAGIHAALTKDVQEDDYETIKRIIVNGGGPSAFPVGTVLHTIKDNYTYPWMFVHHGQHADGRYYAHLRVMKAVDLHQFDSPEAFYYCSEALPAGTYYFNVPTAWSKLSAGNYQFTLSNAVPAGGRLAGLDYLADGNGLTGKSVKVYDSANSMVVAQTAAITTGDTGTYLGLLQAGGDADHPNMNSVHRAGYGSNNYAQSNIYQYLKSAKAAGQVWSSSNKFDNAPSWAASQPGFLTKLPQEFIDIVNPVSMKTITNNVFEVDYTKSSNFTTKEKFWLPSRYQIFGSTEGSDLSEEQWDYYKGASDTDRIMFDNGGSARHQWLRSPSPGSAGRVRHVDASGAVGYYNASVTSAVAPACEISENLLDS